MSDFPSTGAKARLIADTRITRKHLLRDLQPYSCPFDDCSTPQIFYTEKEELEQHFKEIHLTASSFTCRLCEDTGSFDGALALESHIRELHRDDLLEEDIQATVGASAHLEIDWPERCPVCRVTLVEDQPPTCLLKDHLRGKHRGDVLDEDVERIVEHTARPLDSCPKCNFTVSQVLPLTLFGHLSQCLHEFALRALPWNDHLAPAPKQEVGEVFRIKQWIDKSPETFRSHDRLGTPPSPGSIDEDNLNNLHKLFPEIWVSDHPAKQPDTAWSPDSSTLEDSDVLGSPETLPLDDNRYFNEEDDNSPCLISEEFLEMFDFYLKYAIALVELSQHTATSTLLDELKDLRSTPFTDGESLQSAFCHLGRPDGPFRGFDKALLLDENAQLQFQRLNDLTVIAQEGDCRYASVFLSNHQNADLIVNLFLQLAHADNGQQMFVNLQPV